MQKIARNGFDRLERLLDRAFGPKWNPLAQLGPLGWLLFWTVTFTGVYLFIFFDTGVVRAWESVERISGVHWWHAGVARSVHRYASDLMVLVVLLHLLREWSRDRYRGSRWFSWVTGAIAIWFIYLSGFTGYWLVWDTLAQYVATTTTEFLDSLGIFAEPIARNFMAPDLLSSRFFTLMVFLHIAIPLILLMLMWVHVQRITEARTRPPRGLSVITIGAAIVGALIWPATSQAPADLAQVPLSVGLDWIILPVYPLIESLPHGVTWAIVSVFGVLLIGMPWLPRRKELTAAEVTLDHCNGCGRCVDDCPYSAITLVPRTDDLPFEEEVVVDADRCVACGICMGSCPSSTPFRRTGELLTGIDLPDRPLAGLRAEVIEAARAMPRDGPRVMTLSCAFGAAGDEVPGRVVMPCVAMLPPSLIDYIISKGLADGVAIAGCAERDCQHRFGREWTEKRIARTRDPYLRERVPRERLHTIWAGPTEGARLGFELGSFEASLAEMGPFANVRPLAEDEAAEALATTRRRKDR